MRLALTQITFQLASSKSSVSIERLAGDGCGDDQTRGATTRRPGPLFNHAAHQLNVLLAMMWSSQYRMAVKSHTSDCAVENSIFFARMFARHHAMTSGESENTKKQTDESNFCIASVMYSMPIGGPCAMSSL